MLIYRWLKILAGCLGLMIAGCSSENFQYPSYLSRLHQGDQHLGWSINYFNSWRREHQPRYLLLAEGHTISAIRTFSSLESDTSPRISEFYIVRERRTRGCRLLAELQFEAVNYGQSLQGVTPVGCTY